MTLIPKKCSFSYILYCLLPLFVLLPKSKATMPNNSLGKCNNSLGLQDISRLLATPDRSLVKYITSLSSSFLSQSNLSSFQSLVTSTFPSHTVTIEKPLRLYTQVWKQAVSPFFNLDFDFTSPIQKTETTIDKVSLILISGGKPITIHADSRYQVPEILAKSGTNAIAAVDGTFFSLKYLTSNVMIGPILSQVNKLFIPGNNSENKKLTGRPLVLIGARKVSYIKFDPAKHNTYSGIQAEMTDVSDAFVAGAFLVKNGQPSDASSFKNLYGADVARHRAFWGLNKTGVPTIGVSSKPVDSANLAIILTKAGFQDAVMLDSGASTSLAMEGKSLVGYTPRPVPHVVALVPTSSLTNCTIASHDS